MHEWLLTGLSILGTLYNLQKRAAGWVIWSIANLGWIVVFLGREMMAEAFLFAVYLLLSIYGIFKWWNPEAATDRSQGSASPPPDKSPAPNQPD